MVGRPSHAGLARRRRRDGDTAYLSSVIVDGPARRLVITAPRANIPKRGLVQPSVRARIRQAGASAERVVGEGPPPSRRRATGPGEQGRERTPCSLRCRGREGGGRGP